MKELHQSGELVEITGAIREFLDRFYLSRIGIRFLFNQHLSLFNSSQPAGRRYIGSIDAKCDVMAVCEDAIDAAAYICRQVRERVCV